MVDSLQFGCTGVYFDDVIEISQDYPYTTFLTIGEVRVLAARLRLWIQMHEEELG